MTTRMQVALIVGFISIFSASHPKAMAGPPVHSVTGSGLVEEEGVVFRTDLAAFTDASGRAWGNQLLYLDLSVLDLGTIIIKSRVNCVHVKGNSAWVGAVVTESSDTDLVPLGAYTITLVRDGGAHAADIMHGEFFDPDVDCADEPALSETVIISGNYQVR